MRKFGVLLLIILAIISGAVASALAYSFLKGKAGVQGPELKPVIVAARDLTFGQSLADNDLKTVLYPVGSIPKGAYSDSDSLLNQSTKVFLKENEAVLESKLSSIGGGLSLLISPEMRAASIKVDKVSGVSGFVLPGDRVDIIASIVRAGSGQESVAKTVLQNIEVLAAGEATERKGDKVITVQAVTLLVTPEGAQVLALTSQMATLHLALRNPADHDTLAVKSVTKSSMMEEEKKKPVRKVAYKPKKKSPPKPKEEPVSDSLVIIRGSSKKTEVPVMSKDDQKKKTKP
jgi:pilus assembly protein CpaB